MTGAAGTGRAARSGGSDAGRGIAADELKARLADEIARLARDMAAFQATLSALLADGALSPGQVRQLQDLDRATQMLDNLHRVATALAAAHPHPVAETELDALVTLHDLKRRLSGEADGATPTAAAGSDARPGAAPRPGSEHGPDPETDADDISWL